MPEKYRVTQNCYVPFGPVKDGKTRFKRAGQVVELDKRTADKLEGYVESVDAPVKPKKKAAKVEEAVKAYESGVLTQDEIHELETPPESPPEPAPVGDGG